MEVGRSGEWLATGDWWRAAGSERPPFLRLTLCFALCGNAQEVEVKLWVLIKLSDTLLR